MYGKTQKRSSTNGQAIKDLLPPLLMVHGKFFLSISFYFFIGFLFGFLVVCSFFAFSYFLRIFVSFLIEIFKARYPVFAGYLTIYQVIYQVMVLQIALMTGSVHSYQMMVDQQSNQLKVQQQLRFRILPFKNAFPGFNCVRLLLLNDSKHSFFYFLLVCANATRRTKRK